jgi:DNA helicase-2/ATP-dependent DNA helicase PcrA
MTLDTDDDLLADLTPAQHEAVTHFEGPLLVVAGPGSGKTRVITRRVAYLLRRGVRPQNILAITFTNKAAGEMRQRVQAVVPGCRVWISTFHSFGVRILRQYGDRLELDKNFTIYDQNDRQRLTKIALEDADIDSSRFTPDRIQAAISKAKNQLIGPEKFASLADDYFKQVVARVYPAYEKRLREANALDFDDLLYWPALAMKHNEELRSELDARFRFVLIDEYQDTNHAQYAIARGLSMEQPNLCVVGDPNQSIYKFRGSDITNILNFKQDYPDVRIVELDRNYRSTKSILRLACELISNNARALKPNLQTHNEQGKPVHVITFGDGAAEAEGVARAVREAVDRGSRSYRDFAVFVRMNALTRALEQAFVKHGVPFQIVKGLAFFDRKENRDVLAYVRLLLNPHDDLAFERAVNEPARGVGKVSLEHLRNYAKPREISLLTAAEQVEKMPQIKGKAAAGLRRFAALMQELSAFREAAPERVMEEILARSGYRVMLAGTGDGVDAERLANVEELVTAARQFADADSSATIRDFLENITLASDQDSLNEQLDSVSVMTLHTSKGLEFPVVYIIAAEEGILPHERSRHEREELEEERRLLFVGMTRAKEELYLTHADNRDFRGQSLLCVSSSFLKELAESGGELLERVDRSTEFAALRVADAYRSGSPAAVQGWSDAGITPGWGKAPSANSFSSSRSNADPGYELGMLVRHDTYGEGRVTDVGGYGALKKVKVRFSKEGERTFLVEKAKLEIVGSK